MFPIRQLRSAGTLVSASGAAASILRARAAEWEVDLVETCDRLTLHVWGSELSLVTEDGLVRIELKAPEQRLIGTLQDSATELFESHGIDIRWDSVNEGELAPGLSLMKLVSIRRRSPGFIRVRVSGPDAVRFGQGSLHFRLLLPAKGREPVWPRIASNGRTRWPDGKNALHRPVYTVIEQRDDWVEFDIFNHSGSPTCDWTQEAQPGETVGLMGPGGGWCPTADELWLFGDETALPAIARMLKLTTGRVRAFVRAEADDLDELASDPRVTQCDDLRDAMAEACFDPAADLHVWFAGHARDAREARHHLAARGLNKRQFTAAAYWGQPDSAA
ncbi:siderophore-interacting protein [Paracoccus sp. MBLB3053]|uniref:Siderophore-interacting protein n=1 Tax=Paracoccus aurantius TaxID=3073814 RepID=A0ABU2HX89_9RHOB|nr:siderophore-interacting protein [Paracoccus sp. MBLB3053]MDS9469140.1 siderophore-interacting protein [Paracoccus sp. MBLB3053]